MQVLILRLLSMFLWCPGVPALESELTKFLCSVSSLHEAVHHKSDASLWAVLSSAAEDAATWWSWCAWVPCTSWWPCCHQLCSFSVFVVGVATGQCSWSCSSPNHPGGIADTIGPQLEDLQHCCLGECCLKIQLGGVSEESVVHLFDFIRMASSCGSYYINVLGWPKYLAPPEFAFSGRVYRFNLHPGVPLFKKFLKDGLSSAHSKVNEGTGQGNITILIAAPISVQNHCADRIIHHWL